MDHPQPLLERRRGDDSGSADAFSRAILNETDPAVRGYLENLRAQIATIAAKHGANARDVWNREVQDRMSVDEMDKVNALFARIKGISEKKLSRTQEREMLEELEGKRAAAEGMLSEALARFNAIPSSKRWTAGNAIARNFLRAGLLDDALRFCKSAAEFCSRQLMIRVQIDRAKELEREDPDQAFQLVTIAHAWLEPPGFLGSRENFFQDAKTVHDFVERSIANLHGSNGGELLDRILRGSKDFLPIAVPVILASRDRLEVLKSVRLDTALQTALEKFMGERDPFWYVMYRLFDVEMLHAEGKDPRPLLRKLLADVRAGYTPVRGTNAFEEIAKMAGKLGAFDVVEELAAVKLSDRAMPNVRSLAAIGCAEGGHFDQADAYLKSLEMFDRLGPAAKLFDALLDSGQIARAERVYAETTSDTMLLGFRSGREHIAARARRGDDVLAEASAVAANPFGFHAAPFEILTLANAAIATMGYTDEMKKRIAEYATKR